MTPFICIKTKKLKWLAIFLILLMNYQATAHEEPPKTLKEKKEKENARSRKKSNKIAVSQIWRIKVDNGIITEDKEKYAEIGYNTEGYITFMKEFSSKGNLIMTTDLSYDQAGNLLLDMDIDSLYHVVEKTIFLYNSKGLVSRAMSIDSNNISGSVGEYVYYDKKKTIEFKKINSSQLTEYTIVYTYDTDLASGNCILIEKRDVNGKLMMKVENKFNVNGRRTEKSIFSEENKLMYKFVYTYTDAGDFKTITRVSDKEEVVSVDEFDYDGKGNLTLVISRDKDGKIKTAQGYTYELY